MTTVEKTVGMPYRQQHALQKANRYRPDNWAALGLMPCVLMFVGGGFSPATASDLLAREDEAIRWAENGYCVFVVGYRGYGDGYTFRAPDTYSDVAAACAWAKSRAYVDPGKVLAWGSSAGGNLAMKLGVDAAVAAVIAECAPSDISDAASELKLKNWLNNGQGEAYSPKLFIGASTPPHLLIHGTADTTVSYAQSTAYKAAMDAVGVSCDLFTHDGGHGVITDPVKYEEAWVAKLAFTAAQIGV